MIDQEKTTKDWLENISRKNGKADKIIVEKGIRALLLLEGLVKQEIPFVFKGGTSLMLHFDLTKRLSIDIDIILPKEIEDLEEQLDAVAEEQGFLRKELQHRENAQSKIKKEHYKFFYEPLHKTNRDEEYVLLDILIEEVGYSKIISLPIQSIFVPIIDEPLDVQVPILEDILGDKLTAFAPNTTGIPYVKNDNSMSMEIIKQLYDIGNLFDVAEDIEIIKQTFSKFAKTELEYRSKTELNEADVLEDIYQTSLCIVSRGEFGEGNFNELQNGIQRIRSFIFTEKYQLEKAITHASKAAYLSALIKYNAEMIEKFDNPLEVKDWLVDEPINNRLNRLKKSNPEAFFYWYKIYELSK
jgi:3-methyladenine DNA glycosylase AlkC